jgi:hypothetical protein
MATLPLPVRHGEPAGAAQVDIGQGCDSTRLKSSLMSPDCFMRVFQPSSRLQRLMKHETRSVFGGLRIVSQVTAYETPSPEAARKMCRSPEASITTPTATQELPTRRWFRQQVVRRAG